MSFKLQYLTVFLLTISCNENSKQNFANKADKLKTEQELQNERIDTVKGTITDSKTEKAEINKKKSEMNIIDFTETIEVKTMQYEIEFFDSAFYNQIDSLIKSEKKCLNSSLKGLHWVFFKIADNMYELTASSDFGGTYQGYAFIDNSLVFLSPKEPILYKKTERKRSFVFNNKKFPYPEDYSVWIFKFDEGKINIAESYSLPCD